MPKLTNRQKQAIATKLKITEVAIGLFKERKAEDVGIKEICSGADISVGTFYHHFASKEEIISEGYQQVDLLTQSQVEEMTFSGPLETLKGIMRQGGIVLQGLGWVFVAGVYKQLLTVREDYALATDRILYRWIGTSVQEGIDLNLFRPGVDPDDITEALLRVSRGAIFDWCIREGDYDLGTRMEEDTEMVLSHYRD